MKRRKEEIYKERALSYIDRVLSGQRKAGELERLAVERHVRDLREATERGLYFDERSAKRALAFCQLVKHYQGEWAGREFEPEDWQCFILWCIFGWKTRGGVRRFRQAAVEVPRKNGKTMLGAVIALYGLVADEEPGAQVFSAGIDKDQAAICWRAACKIVEQSPVLQKRLKVWTTSIAYESAGAYYKPLSKETKNKDGLNPHFAICDEMHAWPTDELYNLIRSGMGARRQPLIFTITTAGFDMTLPYFQMRRFFIDVLRGVKQDESTFAIIYCPDPDDDWHDPATWRKASPNLGVSVYEDFMQKEYEQAVNKGGTTEVSFKTKNLNLWVDAPDVWIRDELVARCDYGTTDRELEGETCYAGLDLASHVDINALCLYFPEREHPACRFFFWIPEDKVREKEDRVDYRLWHQQGWIRITNGNVIDIDELVQDLARILRRYDVQSIAFDPAKAYHGVIQGLQKEGFDDLLDEFPQGIQNMSEPTKKIEADVSAAQVDLMRNPVVRWMFRNVVIYRDANDNIKMDKKRSTEKIDGCVAMANAYGAYMSEDSSTFQDIGPAFVNL